MSDEQKMTRGCAITAAVVGALFTGCLILAVGIWFGAWAMATSIWHERYIQERNALDAIVPPIAKDPAFKDVHITEESSGGAWISGYVPTTADKKRLRELVIRALGERHGENQMTHVHARDERK
jgi:hypothetical protein